MQPGLFLYIQILLQCVLQRWFVNDTMWFFFFFGQFQAHETIDLSPDPNKERFRHMHRTRKSMIWRGTVGRSQPNVIYQPIHRTHFLAYAKELSFTMSSFHRGSSWLPRIKFFEQYICTNISQLDIRQRRKRKCRNIHAMGALYGIEATSWLSAFCFGRASFARSYQYPFRHVGTILHWCKEIWLIISLLYPVHTPDAQGDRCIAIEGS